MTLTDDLLAEIQRRFEKIDSHGWPDEDCQEGDFLLKLSIALRADRYTIERLSYALKRIAEAQPTGDLEQISKAMLWVNHHLYKYGVQ